MKHMLTEEQEFELLNNCKEIRTSVPYIIRGQEYICKARKGEKQTMKREMIDKFLYSYVKLTDCNGMVMSGYFVPYGKKYKLFPDNGGWDTYVYRPSHIRKLENKEKER